MLPSDIEQAVSAGTNEASDIPAQALQLVEGFKLIQAQSEGVFSFAYKDIAYPGAYIDLTFRKASGDVEMPVIVRSAWCEITVKGTDYKQERIYPKTGKTFESYMPTDDQTVAEVLKMVARTARECLLLRNAQQETPSAPGQKAAAVQTTAEDMSGEVRKMQEFLSASGNEIILSAQEIQAATLAGFKDAEGEITQDKRAGKGLLGGLDYLRTQAPGFGYTPDYRDDGGVTITATIPKGRDIVIEINSGGEMQVDGAAFEATAENMKKVLQIVAKEARAALFRPARKEALTV